MRWNLSCPTISIWFSKTILILDEYQIDLIFVGDISNNWSRTRDAQITRITHLTSYHNFKS